MRDEIYSLALGRGNWFDNPGAPLPEVRVAELPVLGGQHEAGGDEIEEFHTELPLHSLDVHVEPVFASELRGSAWCTKAIIL